MCPVIRNVTIKWINPSFSSELLQFSIPDQNKLKFVFFDKKFTACMMTQSVDSLVLKSDDLTIAINADSDRQFDMLLKLNPAKIIHDSQVIHTFVAFKMIRNLEQTISLDHDSVEKIIKLGKKYNIASKYTSFVSVHPNPIISSEYDPRLYDLCDHSCTTQRFEKSEKLLRRKVIPNPFSSFSRKMSAGWENIKKSVKHKFTKKQNTVMDDQSSNITIASTAITTTTTATTTTTTATTTTSAAILPTTAITATTVSSTQLPKDTKSQMKFWSSVSNANGSVNDSVSRDDIVNHTSISIDRLDQLMIELNFLSEKMALTLTILSYMKSNISKELETMEYEMIASKLETYCRNYFYGSFNFDYVWKTVILTLC